MICNAKIKSTTLGIEDHGMMIFFIAIEWPGGGASLGGYSLDRHSPTKIRKGCGHSYQAIRIILETLKVESWEKLPGTLIRIKDPGAGALLNEIGHILEDRWFNLGAYMKEGTD